MLILLDLNYTLVANSAFLRGRPLDVRQRTEKYRGWLVDVLRMMAPEKVILVTVRGQVDQEWTLRRIAEELDGWQPDEAVFNHRDWSPPVFKEWALKNVIFPKYGSDPSRYLAVESNTETHKMYDRYGIKGFKAYPSTEDQYDPHRDQRSLF